MQDFVLRFFVFMEHSLHGNDYLISLHTQNKTFNLGLTIALPRSLPDVPETKAAVKIAKLIYLSIYFPRKIID